jgi:hypothetical protein
MLNHSIRYVARYSNIRIHTVDRFDDWNLERPTFSRI